MPPEIDDFDDEKEEKGSAQERFRAKIAEIEDSDDDEGDSTDEPSVRMERNEDDGTEEPVVQLSRKDKKRDRLRMREENEVLRRQTAEMAQRLARLEGATSALHRQRDVDDETDVESEVDEAIDRKLTELQDEHTAAWNALRAKGNNATQADKDEYARKIREIDRRKVKITAESIVIQRMSESQQAVQQEVVRAQIRAKHADVYENPRAVGYAEGEYRKLLALGRKDGPETLDMAMQSARVAFKMVRESTPSASQRARFSGSGVPRGRPAAAEQGGESIKMTRELRKMADAAYSHIPDQGKRYETWAKGPGRAFLASQKKGD